MERSVYIIRGMRVSFIKSMTAYIDLTRQELMPAATLIALAGKYNLKGQVIGDVGIGGAIKNSLDGDFAHACIVGSRSVANLAKILSTQHGKQGLIPFVRQVAWELPRCLRVG